MYTIFDEQTKRLSLEEFKTEQEAQTELISNNNYGIGDFIVFPITEEIKMAQLIQMTFDSVNDEESHLPLNTKCKIIKEALEHGYEMIVDIDKIKTRITTILKASSIKDTIILKRDNLQHNLTYINSDKDKIEVIFRANDGGIIPVAEAQAIDSLNGYQKKDELLKVKITKIIDEEMFLDIFQKIVQ